MLIYEIIKVLVLGIVEGITEWLPISSTGHMILIDEILRLNVSENFLKMFLVVIQLGAICAVPVLFWERLNPISHRKTRSERTRIWSTWGKVTVGAIPASVIGLLLDDLLDRYLYNYFVVAIALIVYGVAFICVEKSRVEGRATIYKIEDLGYFDAVKIGLFQSLSLIPGTSRSGSSILGGMLCGVSREVSAEFSFFMAIPIMLGASGLKIVKFILAGFTVDTEELLILLVGITVAFIVSLSVIRFLMEFVKRHDFTVFGYYRIGIGIIIILYFWVKQSL